MKLVTRAELIRGTLNAAKHFDWRNAKQSAKWLRMVADALLMEYLFDSKCVLYKVRIADTLNGLTETKSDSDLMDWCWRTNNNHHLLLENMLNLYSIPEVAEFRNVHSKDGLLIRDEKDNLVPRAELKKQKGITSH